MPASGLVSVKRQCVYAAIPCLDMYSAYHIKKLRQYLLVILCTIMIPQIAIELMLFGNMASIQDAYTGFLYPESEYFYPSVYVMLWLVVGITWSITLIRYWSIRWNVGLNEGSAQY